MSVKTIHRLLAVVEEFRKIDPIMGVQTVSAFLYVAANPSCTAQQISDAVGLPQSTVSRNMLLLGSMPGHKTGGYGLVTDTDDPAERRRKIYSLSAKGKRVLNSISTLIEGVS